MQPIRQLLRHVVNHPKYKESYKKTVKEIFNYPEIRVFLEENQDSLTQEMIENSLSKLNEYMNEMKMIKSGKTGQNPGFRPKLFVNYNYIDVTYMPTKQYIEREIHRKQQSLIDNRMMSYDVRHAELADFTLESEERQQLMHEIIRFIEEYQKNPHLVQGLYLTGPFGVGKTFLLGALANDLIKHGVSVTMIHYPTFVTEMKQTFSDNSTQSRLDQVKKVDVLIIDDIGAEANTVWVRDEVLNTILEYRMKESLATFFTSNFNLTELENHLRHTRDGGDESTKAKRLMERIRYLSKEVSLGGPNRRQVNRRN